MHLQEYAKKKAIREITKTIRTSDANVQMIKKNLTAANDSQTHAAEKKRLRKVGDEMLVAIALLHEFPEDELIEYAQGLTTTLIAEVKRKKIHGDELQKLINQFNFVLTEMGLPRFTYENIIAMAQ